MKVKKIYKGISNMSVLKQIRDRLNMSQEEFARLLDVSIYTLSRWENCKQNPTFTFKQVKILAMLLRGMNLQLTDLPDDLKGEVPEIILIK